MNHIMNAIDWLSIKLTGAGVIMAAINWNNLTMTLTILALSTTFIYNLIRIYKEVKNKKP